jgi:predicted Rdx family selenoprotein
VVPGETSQFDVISDGRVVFSKRQSGRFPDDGEIARLLEAS